ncbi:hypothetical protein [Leptospira licerasiae]|uniref:hypothetical protein n=1 Tax=Leptospira licerasiae TaxID=447106 RepID=UPI001082D439|nr:hypothetical protein [Leptospira licerasiae]TGM88999.1 hypothetical protein EHR05_12420 [Leptospira licerasiae]
MSKVLYILGAGASAGCIPIVGAMNSDLIEFSRRIYKTVPSPPAPEPNVIASDVLSEVFVEDCIWLGKEAQSHGTIDLFAKKLYLQRKYDELSRLKCTLSFYLLLIQMSVRHDIRYDVFLTTIAQLGQESVSLPKDLIISTWNYDNQILLSLSYLLDFFDPNYALQHLNIRPWHKESKYKEEIPSLFHTNGLAGFVNSSFTSFDFYGLLSKGLNDDSIVEFNKRYEELKEGINKIEILINFAWEKGGLVESVREEFYQRIKDVEVIVVIGYSFPTFNREYDRRVFREAKSLKKIYVQDRNPAGPIERLNSILDKNFIITPIKDVNQFYIPSELVV